MGKKLTAKQKKQIEFDKRREEDTECTCKTGHWSAHPCSYASDVHDDPDKLCECCPYCTKQCAMDI